MVHGSAIAMAPNIVIKAGSYSRISRDEDKKNYSTILSQNANNTSYVKEKFEVDIVDYYIDDNMSGYSLDRPDFKRLIDDVDSGKINTIIAKDLSRIGRHNAYVLLFLEDMKRKGVRLIAINDSYDSFLDSDDIIGIKTWYNEMYIKDISKKIRGNINSMQKEGKFLCAVPFGYRIDSINKQKIIVDESCAWIVRKIFEMYINGSGYRTIAIYLTDINAPTPSMINKQHSEEKGKPYKKEVTHVWGPTMIMRLVRNDFYIGTLRQGKNKIEHINGKNSKTDKDDHFVFTNNHEPIISKEDFDLAQSLVEKRSTTNYRGAGTKHKNLFSGFMFCADCGSYMASLNKAGKNKSYICGSYNQRGRSACSTHYIIDKKVEEALKEYLSYVKDKLNDYILKVEVSVENGLKQKQNFLNSIKTAELELQNTSEELKILYGQKIKDMAKNPVMADMISQTYEEIENEKQQKIVILKSQIEELKSISLRSNDFENNIRTAADIIDELINKKELEKRDLEIIIERIVVYEKGGLKIYLKGNIDSIISDSDNQLASNDDDDLPSSRNTSKGTLRYHRLAATQSKDWVLQLSIRSMVVILTL